jgi:hypothetical protein
MKMIKGTEEKRELVSQTLGLCKEMYYTFDQLSKDFPGYNSSNVYEAYKDKINNLKETLKENSLFTTDVDNRLQMVLNASKSLDHSLYSQDMDKLTKLMFGFID